MNIRNKISRAFAKKSLGTLRRFLPFAVVAALGVGVLAHASSVAEWTPGTIRAANALFGPRSGWLFTMAPSGHTLIGNLEGDPRLRQAVQYNAFGQLVQYTEVTSSPDHTTWKVRTNTYDTNGRIIESKETIWTSTTPADPPTSLTTIDLFSYNEFGQISSEIEVNHETGVIVVLNPGRLRFVDSAGNDLTLCRCTRCCSDEPR